MIVKFRRFCIVLSRQFLVFLLIFTIGLFIFTLSYNKSNNYTIYKGNVDVGDHDEEVAINTILRLIKVRNRGQIIVNIDAFGPVTNDTIILVIMVDKNYINDGLKNLLASFKSMHGIEEFLLIFSHSYYDYRLDRFIRKIDYCRFLQIYYPFSVQLYPDKFPGRSSKDCPYDMNLNEAVSSNCTGVHTPDIKGRYRVPNETQKKHHWWWTANTVFEKLSFSTEHTGLVIFLDDHLIFTNDFIYMTSYMKNIADLQPRCEFLSFGNYSLLDSNKKGYIKEKDFYSAELSFWDPKNYWNILGFDVSVWNSIVAHYDLFCSFDDSSWLRSLYYISLNKKDGKRYKVLSSMAPRAFRLIRSCKPYQMSKCDQSEYQYHFSMSQIRKFEERNIDNWFPPFLELYINLEYQDDDDVYDMIEGNGGFADPRDRALCRNMTVSKFKKVVLEMKYKFRDMV